MCTPTHSIITSENSDSRGSPREGAQTITELFGLGVSGGAGEGWGAVGVEREVGTSCNAFALPPCHSIKVIVFLIYWSSISNSRGNNGCLKIVKNE